MWYMLITKYQVAIKGHEFDVQMAAWKKRERTK